MFEILFVLSKFILLTFPVGCILLIIVYAKTGDEGWMNNWGKYYLIITIISGLVFVILNSLVNCFGEISISDEMKGWIIFSCMMIIISHLLKYWIDNDYCILKQKKEIEK